ncbi:AAA family ATPase [Colletotrichum musicola]|uniref:AAA family ATPase n=1 Tax=Colletotrichum musicola TaxID=2175873 RepID=A0A8H6NDP4_9PEZI|nr:AAA family ATPase [Colletotrichum musicola]
MIVKNKLKFKIPDWFIERRIKTPAELRESPDRLVLYDNNTPDGEAQPESGAAQAAENGDQSHTNDQQVHRAPREKLEELVDMGNGILTSGASNNCWDTESTIILTSMDSESAYLDYLEPVVHDMAKRMGVIVITIDTSELEFLGWGLYLQGKEWHVRREPGLIGKNSLGMPMPERSWDYAMASLYFGGREVDKKRQRLAMTAIFDAARAKAIETNSWISPKRIVVYLRNCHEILEAMIAHNEHGLGCLRAFTNYVRELREKSQNAFLVCAMPGDWADILPLKVIDNLSRLDWKQPLEVHVDPLEAIAVNPAFVAAETRRTNMFRLQCRLRWRCPERVEAQLLDFFFDWPGLTDDEREAIESRHWEEDELDRAEVQICGRSQCHKPVGFADVLMILRRTGLLDWYPEEEIEPEPESEQEEEPKPKLKRKERSGCDLEPDRPPKKSKKTGKYKEDRRWRKKMAKLTKSCDDYEVKLIDNVVNPDELNTSWGDVILDQYTKDSMIQLVSLSRLRPEASSSFMLNNIRISGALLYGPPGTGNTHLCRAMARASGSNMLAHDPAALMSKWVDDSEKYIRAAFTLAEKLHRCIVLPDEVDAVFFRRSSSDSTSTRKDLDEAFLRRLPRKVAFGLPDEECRVRILWTFLSADDLDSSVDVAALARETKGYSGSDLRNVCAQAGLAWSMEQAQAGSLLEGPSEPVRLMLTKTHFAQALRAIRPSNSGVSSKLLGFARRFNPELSGETSE